MSLADSLKSLNEFDINDLDVNNAGIWPAPIKAIVVLIVFALIAGGGYWFFVKDQYVQLERVEKTEQDLRKKYEEKAYQVANLEVFKAQMAEMEETFGALVRQLPSETEVPGLLEDITNTALGNGLSLQEVALQPEQRRDFYSELPINIRVTGSYHELASFVSSVASLPRIVTLHDLTIKPTGGDGERLDMQVVARTYRYRAGE
ncbi:type 4a pilus biogenesis protein PilO [Marinobacter adhaerens]|jgi:type IV pilus assembly protein PilO|uniref:Type 4a pilus biogenesis protein PilO n=2 Tax=Marinobacter adhaerens TaxID=1033846 RepID=A0ABX8IK81_9GAMM|nr:type 4a pilus biogenesis protein PilO [Marinobacter adhaerens]PHS45413.1 MAG: pilus assembly protein PilP [Marinobacter sp.]ADP96240.1 type 4 fimbrial biogenesis protein PilO [Marinobacter adhaerens HP15]MBW4980195.1 type 4a pilus biogenesis protein PilO [Marinobacter adhaerens]MCK5865909.1 type 4a pilus biogenesis protein PilO [Marinobacter adhaerens]QWV14242.1 type 4a pilus biogenesis protein PilO [Marinobacter adhaerens]